MELDLRKGEKVGVNAGALYLAPTGTSLVGPNLLFVAMSGSPIVATRAVGNVLVIPVLPGGFRICTAP